MTFSSVVFTFLACQDLVGDVVGLEYRSPPSGKWYRRKVVHVQQIQAVTKTRVLRYTRVDSGKLRSGTIDKNSLLPVSKETLSPGVDLSCEAVAVELVYKEIVAHLVTCLREVHDNQVFLASFLRCF